ncbi:micronemal protein 4 [Cyclospora cayetanensis]|uniref:PAN domain-containing protein n=2 Tax=Cyclospora cayetanensis TaxID=88456 RepID=A0A1D3D067_9EIME|nr:micronemal protein 4 [Cyclospora cayetanensis]OEH76779.1 PAN domain-containing protein [Cyclospora cayetanensis]
MRSRFCLQVTAGAFAVSVYIATCEHISEGQPAFPIGFTCIEFNSDYSGEELARFPASTPQACRERCSQESECTFITHNVLSSICVLRKGPPYVGKQHRVNVASAPKECLKCPENDVAYKGESLGSSQARSASHCQALCVEDESCSYFTFDILTWDCHMFKKGAIEFPEMNKISGRRDCSVDKLAIDPAPSCAVRHVAYTGSVLETASAEDAVACQMLCQQRSSCEAFVFDTASGTCSLHLALAEATKTSSTTAISGPRECAPKCMLTGKSYRTSEELLTVEQGLDTAEECQLRCQSTTNCGAWSFASASRKCDLFENASEEREEEGITSGPKYCPGACDTIGFHSPALEKTWYSKETLELEACREACRAEPKCVIFTWWGNDRCFLKEDSCLTNLEPQADTVRTGWGTCSSCFRQGKGYSVAASVLLWSLDTQNAEECRQRCAFMEECSRFTYDTATKVCSFLRGEAGDEEGDTLISGPANCVEDTSCILRNIMWQNNSNFVITTNDPSDAEGCLALCQKTPKCNFWTFNKDRLQCNLKTGNESPKILPATSASFDSGPKRCMKTSGLCLELNIDYHGGDIYKTAQKPGGEPACREDCYHEPQCRAYTYKSGNGNCWLKTITGFTGRREEQNAMSGSKIGCPKCQRAGMAYVGTLIKQLKLPNHAICQLACEAEDKCEFFTFDTECKLYPSAVTVKTASYSVVSGPKRC